MSSQALRCARVCCASRIPSGVASARSSAGGLAAAVPEVEPSPAPRAGLTFGGESRRQERLVFSCFRCWRYRRVNRRYAHTIKATNAAPTSSSATNSRFQSVTGPMIPPSVRGYADQLSLATPPVTVACNQKRDVRRHGSGSAASRIAEEILFPRETIGTLPDMLVV